MSRSSAVIAVSGPPKIIKRFTKPELSSDVFVGKDVLELVSSAMYVDPMTLFREYIQNAADAIDASLDETCLQGADDARNRELMRRVDISVDHATRSVRIRDYACGIPSQEFCRKLLALGGSEKRGSTARGFRGVGRLVGLGYAQELIFCSRAQGERTVSRLLWDSRRLRMALRDPCNRSDIAAIIRDVITYETLESDEHPECFFEVELRGIVRLRNDPLVSPNSIADYLCQVAPLPFSPDFRFAADIEERLGEYVDLRGVDIYVNGAEQPLFRPHRNEMMVGQRRPVCFNDVSFVEVPGIDSGRAAVGWILHHEYLGTIPKSAHVAGLRLRVGNIQVGDDSSLRELFKEPRFNGWSIGEIHVVDERIVPNGRRDQFEQNAHYHHVTNHLAPVARDITHRCRRSSRKRYLVREFNRLAQFVIDNLSIIEQGSVSHGIREQLIESIKLHLLRMTKIAENVALLDWNCVGAERVQELQSRFKKSLGEGASVAQPLERLPSVVRKSYEHLFQLIYECSTNHAAAKALVDKILIRLQ